MLQGIANLVGPPVAGLYNCICVSMKIVSYMHTQL